MHDEFGRMGPYAYKGTQWVSYDSPDMVRKKSLLVRSLKLGGGMVWALDLDDFKIGVEMACILCSLKSITCLRIHLV